MSTRKVLQKVKNYLQNSATFAFLPESERANYLIAMEQAKDEQLMHVLKQMQEEDKKHAKVQEELANATKVANELVEIAEKLNHEIRETKKFLLKGNEEREQLKSKSIIAQLEEKLGCE